MGLLEQCFQEKSTGTIQTGEQWIQSGINAQALAQSGNWVAVACPTFLQNGANGGGAMGGRGPTGKGTEFTNLFQGEMITFQNMLFLVVVNKIIKMPGGLKVLQSIAKDFIKGMFSSLHALGQASSANKVAAWANPYLISLVMERFGFVDGWRMPEYRIGLSVISGAQVATDIAGTIAGIFPFSSPQPAEFPTNIVFSAADIEEKINGE